MLEKTNVRLRDTEVLRVYREAFPPAERMPFPMMVALSRLPNTRFWAFREGESLRGFVYLAAGRRMVYLLFLAVDRAQRGRGCGGEILAAVRRAYPDRQILVSIETCAPDAPDLDARRRRREFYLRGGFRETGWHIRLGGVTQDLLSQGGTFSRGRLRAFLAAYSCGTLWPKIWQDA